MAHEEYLLGHESVRQQNERVFNWSLRPTIHLAPLIIIDGRLSRYSESIKDWAGRIAVEHGEPLQKVEVIIGQWLLDNNFDTIVLRWTSARGTFQREFGVTTHKQGREEHHVLTPELPDASLII